MRKLTSIFAALSVLAIGGSAFGQAAHAQAYVTAAVADAGRPAADTARDSHRKPADMVAFAGIKPGSQVGELIPGGGYFTRVFSKVVGPGGHVYAVVAPPRAPVEGQPAQPQRPVAVEAIAADPAYSNLTVLRQPYASWTAPVPLDVVWTSQNYHDMRRPGADMLAVNKAVFNALKPGGTYIVLDHAADAGSTDTNLHRIDPALVKADVLAAGFEFVGESDVLRNPKDDHKVGVMDSSIRGDTDQFIYKFRRPIAK